MAATYYATSLICFIWVCFFIINTLSQVSASTSLLNISRILNTFMLKPRSSTRMKKKVCFELLYSTTTGFNTQLKIESLQVFCIADDTNSTRNITLKNCARSTENFRKKKRCKHFPL